MSDPPEVSNAFLEKLLRTLAEGPIGQQLLELAEGKRQVVVRQNTSGQGWIVETRETPTDLTVVKFLPGEKLFQ